MIFSENFFEKLPTDIVEARKSICDCFNDFQEGLGHGAPAEYDPYDDYLDAFAGLEQFVLANNLNTEFPIPPLTDDRRANTKRISEFYYAVQSKTDKILAANVLEAARFKYKSQLSNSFAYKLSDGDLSRIQELINELRNKITASEVFSENHKERLLAKLESMQKELHKRMSSLDKFWTFVGEAGVIIGKFGNDVRPIVDRIREIITIVWRAQSMAEELPSGMPLPMLDSPININTNGKPAIDDKTPKENTA